MSNGIIRLDEGWRFDEGHHFDQPPNVPRPAPPPVLKHKGKHMDYVPRKRSDQYLWLKQISDNAVAQVALIGAPAGDGTAVKAAADDIIATMDTTDTASGVFDGARDNEETAQTAGLGVIRDRV